MNRRQLLITGAAALAETIKLHSRPGSQAGKRLSQTKIPLVHITDLYHPPQDPDDHIDLATVAALDEYELKGVILDVTDRFLKAAPAGFDIHRDPGFIPVVQLSYMLGRAIPVAVGPKEPLASPTDDLANRPTREQAGVRLLLDILSATDNGVVISAVGSARVLAAAYNRDPDLLHAKIRSILLNAGSTGGTKREWNVSLDPEAYKRLWHTGLPIHWYPCATDRSAFDPSHERGTYWKTTHERLFRTIAPALQAWFSYAFTGGKRSDAIQMLSEQPARDAWHTLLAQERNLWATASLVMGAGRILAKQAEGWRFIPADAAAHATVWPWRLDPILATVNERAEVHWTTTTEKANVFLFGRQQGSAFGDAMAEALGSLLGMLLR